MNLGPWTTPAFDAMSWHDVHVHGFRFASLDESLGSADLVLDIDYILQWAKCGSAVEFTVCPADLTFHDVFGLRMELDYAGPSAGMCPFSIGEIEREVVRLGGDVTSFRWRIRINWPRGMLEFQSPGFTQVLTGEPRTQAAQALTPGNRHRVVPDR